MSFIDNMKCKLKNNNGAALALVIFFTAILLTMSAIFINLAVNNYLLKDANYGKINRYYNAKAGVEESFAVVDAEIYQIIDAAIFEMELDTTLFIVHIFAEGTTVDINKVRQYYFNQRFREGLYTAGEYYLEAVLESGGSYNINVLENQRNFFDNQDMSTLDEYIQLSSSETSDYNNLEYKINIESEDAEGKGEITALISVKVPMYSDYEGKYDLTKKFAKLTYIDSTY